MLEKMRGPEGFHQFGPSKVQRMFQFELRARQSGSSCSLFGVAERIDDRPWEAKGCYDPTERRRAFTPPAIVEAWEWIDTLLPHYATQDATGRRQITRAPAASRPKRHLETLRGGTDRD